MAQKKKTPASDPTSPSFEERMEALEAVVRDLEGDELSLEAAIERYRAGVEHLRACRALLDDAEERLVELVQDGDGGTGGERPLKVSERGLEPDES